MGCNRDFPKPPTKQQHMCLLDMLTTGCIIKLLRSSTVLFSHNALVESTSAMNTHILRTQGYHRTQNVPFSKQLLVRPCCPGKKQRASTLQISLHFPPTTSPFRTFIIQIILLKCYTFFVIFKVFFEIPTSFNDRYITAHESPFMLSS